MNTFSILKQTHTYIYHSVLRHTNILTHSTFINLKLDTIRLHYSCIHDFQWFDLEVLHLFVKTTTFCPELCYKVHSESHKLTRPVLKTKTKQRNFLVCRHILCGNDIHALLNLNLNQTTLGLLISVHYFHYVCSQQILCKLSRPVFRTFSHYL